MPWSLVSWRSGGAPRGNASRTSVKRHISLDAPQAPNVRFVNMERYNHVINGCKSYTFRYLKARTCKQAHTHASSFRSTWKHLQKHIPLQDETRDCVDCRHIQLWVPHQWKYRCIRAFPMFFVATFVFRIAFKQSQYENFRMGKFPPGRKYFASCWSCFPAVGLPIRRTEFGRWKHGRGQKSQAVSWRKTVTK